MKTLGPVRVVAEKALVGAMERVDTTHIKPENLFLYVEKVLGELVL